jgi:hypothetical protein
MSLLNMHTWAPRDIRKLIITYLDTMSRAMVLAAHGLRWMWLIQNACAGYESTWSINWMPDQMLPSLHDCRTNKGVRKHKYMIKHASLEQLEWLCSENAFVPSRDMVGYACLHSTNTAQWLCIQTKTNWDDITINNTHMLQWTFRHDIPAMLPYVNFIGSGNIDLRARKIIRGAVYNYAIKILRTVCNEIITQRDYDGLCAFITVYYTTDHEIYKIVRGMTRVDYIIETMCVDNV